MDKAFLTTVIVLVLAIALMLPVLFGTINKAITQTYDNGLKFQEDTYQKITYTEMTDAQRREDFDYYFEMLKTSMPNAYNMREKFGYSVLDNYDRYLKAVENCKDDYQFIAFMTSLANEMPSGHSSLVMPSYYDYFSSGYFRTETVGLNYAENMRGRLDAYYDYLVDKQSDYNQKIKSAISFTYTDGEYLCTGGSNDYFHSVLTAVNGESPDKFAVETLSPVGQVCFDTKFDKPYRNQLWLSTAGEESVMLTLKLQDGSTTQAEFFTDIDLCYSLYYGGYYTEEFESIITGDDRTEFEVAPDADDDSVVIYDVREYNMAYIELDSLLYSDGTVIKERLREISDYDNIVIDLRGNGGGMSNFFEEYIYPSLYKEDKKFTAEGYIPKTKYTDGMYGSVIDKAIDLFYNNATFKTAKSFPDEMYDCADGQYYKYTFSHDLYGDSSLTYSEDRNVYYIVNNYTCSAADEIAQMVKECDLGKVVGTNTLGEGLILGVCCDWLPNSLLMYMYCPMYCVDSEGVNNALYGTQPDIRGGTDVEGFILSDEMEIEGIDWRLPENRAKWDRNYRMIIDDIESRQSAAA